MKPSALAKQSFSVAALIALITCPLSAQADDTTVIPIDRTVVRFFSRDGTGIDHPCFISERTLAFESRLAELEQHPIDHALDSANATPSAPQAAAIRAAIDTHIAEELLANLPMQSPPSHDVILERAAWMRKTIIEAIGSEAALHHAAAVEGIGPDEIDALIMRKTRAALYIDRTSTPLFEIQIDQLRAAFGSYSDRFKTNDFAAARDPFARWLAWQRLRTAEMAFFQQARSQVHVAIIADR